MIPRDLLRQRARVCGSAHCESPHIPRATIFTACMPAGPHSAHYTAAGAESHNRDFYGHHRSYYTLMAQKMTVKNRKYSHQIQFKNTKICRGGWMIPRDQRARVRASAPCQSPHLPSQWATIFTACMPAGPHSAYYTSTWHRITQRRLRTASYNTHADQNMTVTEKEILASNPKQ